MHELQCGYTQILVVVLGQELPDEAADTAQQVFGLIVAAVGLAAFALVLALVEQVVLQVLDDNVRRGSRVFETGHVSTRLCTAARHHIALHGTQDRARDHGLSLTMCGILHSHRSAEGCA